MEIIDVAPAARLGAASQFIGEVQLAELAAPEPPGRVRVLLVTFAAGARTNWHTHPFGQVLHVVEGTARVQADRGPVRLVAAGGTVRFGPGERHWHGATPDAPMAHLAIQEANADGVATNWAGPVSEVDYQA